MTGTIGGDAGVGELRVVAAAVDGEELVDDARPAVEPLVVCAGLCGARVVLGVERVADEAEERDRLAVRGGRAALAVGDAGCAGGIDERADPVGEDEPGGDLRGRRAVVLLGAARDLRL